MPSAGYTCRYDGSIVRKADIIKEPHFPGSSRAAHMANAELCESMCSDMQECKAYYYKKTGYCYLLSQHGRFDDTERFASVFVACMKAEAPVPAPAPASRRV